MRLLHRKNDGNISLTDDLGIQDIPAYAILAHTLGRDDEEVIFKDVQDNSKKETSKAGVADYRKIQFCGKQAASDGLEYFWVETCCTYLGKTPLLTTPYKNGVLEKEIDAAEKELQALRERIVKMMDAIQLPKDWIFDLLPPKSTVPPSGKANSSGPKTGGVPSPKAKASAPPPADGNKRSPADRKKQKASAPSSTEQAGTQDPDPMDIDLQWAPGQTTRGEDIIAYRPLHRKFIERNTGRAVEVESMTTHYVIMKEGQKNPIKIVKAARVGRQAAQAYRELPEDQKHSITNISQSYEKSDAYYYGGIKGFASQKTNSPSGNLPWGVVLITYNGKDLVINRSALRNMLGHEAADDEIKEFLKNTGKKPERSRRRRLQARLEATDYELWRMRGLREARGSELWRNERRSNNGGNRAARSESESDSSSSSSSGSGSDINDSRPLEKHSRRRLARQIEKLTAYKHDRHVEGRREEGRRGEWGDDRRGKIQRSNDTVSRKEMMGMMNNVKNDMMKMMMEGFGKMGLPAAST